MVTTSSIRSVIIRRLKKRAGDEELDVTDNVVQEVLTHMMWNYLGLKTDWGNLELDYNAQHHNVVLVAWPVLQETLRKLVEETCNERFRKRVCDKVTKIASNQKVDAQGYRWPAWAIVFEKACVQAMENAAETAVKNLARRLALEDAQAIFAMGEKSAVEQLSSLDVVSVHDERMASRDGTPGRS